MFTFLLSILFPLMTPECRDCKVRSDDKREILVFMSTSVPLESWKYYSQEMEHTGGSFILRGFPDNSLVRYAEKIQELRQEGIYVPIDLDPNSFVAYHIETVPSIVIRDQTSFDKVAGNYALDAFLQEAASKGDVKSLSEQKLKTLRTQP